MGTISSLQQRMDEKLAQFQDDVRLRQEEAATKALQKARYDNSCVSYSIPLASLLGHLLPTLTWSSSFVRHNWLGCSAGSIFVSFIFCGVYFCGVYFLLVSSPHKN